MAVVSHVIEVCNAMSHTGKLLAVTMSISTICVNINNSSNISNISNISNVSNILQCVIKRHVSQTTNFVNLQPNKH